MMELIRELAVALDRRTGIGAMNAWWLVMAVVVAAVLTMAAALSGCGETRTRTASVSRTTGVQAGQPVDLTTVSREEARAQTQVELGPMIQAAVATATGDLRGALRALAERPAAPTASELERIVDQKLSGAPTRADIETAMRELFAQRPNPPTADEVARLVKDQFPQPGMDPTTGGALGALAGVLMLALREFLAHRKTQKDEAEGWAEALKLAKALPPEKAP